MCVSVVDMWMCGDLESKYSVLWAFGVDKNGNAWHNGNGITGKAKVVMNDLHHQDAAHYT